MANTHTALNVASMLTLILQLAQVGPNLHVSSLQKILVPIFTYHLP